MQLKRCSLPDVISMFRVTFHHAPINVYIQKCIYNDKIKSVNLQANSGLWPKKLMVVFASLTWLI